MIKKILITGASGLIGSRLTETLSQKGYQISHLGRKAKTGRINSFVWDVENGKVENEALQGVDIIVHLAGAGVADKRWNSARKKEILESRTKSTALLYDLLKNNNHSVKAVVSASAIGYYGFGLDEHIYTEQSEAGNDFLAQVTKKWEEEVDKISSLGVRVVKLRTGIVLSNQGGALTEIANVIRWWIGSPLGSGRQYVSWIHIDDLCNMYIKAIEDDGLQGSYNAVCNWATNKELTTAIAKTLHKPLWLPNVPSFVMKIVVGEMADLVVFGSKVSSTRIRQSGFNFKYESLSTAVESLLS